MFFGFFFIGNEVWFQKETCKGIQDFTGMTMSKKQETAVRFLKRMLRRNKHHSIRKPRPGAPVIFCLMRVQRWRPPMTRLLSPSPTFTPTATCYSQLMAGETEALSVVPESTAAKAEIRTESKTSEPTGR